MVQADPILPAALTVLKYEYFLVKHGRCEGF
jgi:hypothetical protein